MIETRRAKKIETSGPTAHLEDIECKQTIPRIRVTFITAHERRKRLVYRARLPATLTAKLAMIFSGDRTANWPSCSMNLNVIWNSP